MLKPSVDSVEQFYNQLAGEYHHMYSDWKSEVLRQGEVLDTLIRRYVSPVPCSVLDPTCGIGTQAIGLAARGYSVHATDLSSAAIDRAKEEAQNFGVTMSFDVADIRALEQRITGIFDIVISFDNSLSHLLQDNDLLMAANQIRKRLRKNGLFLASIRDYDQVLSERKEFRAIQSPPLPGVAWLASPAQSQPTMPRVFDDTQGRRIVFQIWDWADDESSYAVNHFQINNSEGKWITNCYVTRFRALKRSDLSAILVSAGFSDVLWLMPEESGYYQPVAIAFNRLISA